MTLNSKLNLRLYIDQVKPILLLFMITRTVLLLLPFILTNYGIKTNWVIFDAEHYINIAKESYKFAASDNAYGNTIAFFPLYPLFIKFFYYFLGSYEISALFVANFSALVASLYLYGYVREKYDNDTGYLAVALFLTFPSSIFLVAPYTESLFALLLIMFFYYLEKQKLWPCVIVGGLASVTRIPGCFLFLLFAYHAYQSGKRNRNFFVPTLQCIVIGIPFLLFLYFQQFEFGTPIAFIKAQLIGWDGRFRWATDTISQNILKTPNSTRAFGDLFTAVFVLSTLLFYRKRVSNDWMFYCLAHFIISLSSSSSLSFQRYMMPIIPIYIIWGAKLARTAKHTQIAVLIFLTVIMTTNGVVFLFNQMIH